MNSLARDHSADRSPIPEKILSGVRVLVIFGGTELLGQARGNIEVFRAMAEVGLRAKFVIRSGSAALEIAPELEAWGFKWIPAPFGYHWGKFLLGRQFYYFFVNLFGVIVTSWKVWLEARRWRPTHLYAANWLHFTYVLPAAMVLGLPRICRIGDAPPTGSVLQRWAFAAMVRPSAVVVCISEFVSRLVHQRGMPKARTRVIYNYPPKRRNEGDEPPGQHLGTDSAIPVVLFIGQIIPSKGVGILVEAIRILRDRGVIARLVLAGSIRWSQDFFANLESRIAALKMESQVSFRGYVPDVATLLSESHVHVCPSICQEALGNVVLEAKLASRPSVVFPDGGLPELIEHKVDGYICRACSEEALVEGLLFFLENESLRKRAGQAARSSLDRKFGYDRFKRDWSRVFAGI